MAQTESAGLTFEKYLKRDEAADIRYELIDGQLHGMVDTTESHNLITLGLAFALRQRLQDSGCRVLSENVRLRVGTDENSDGFYPDVMVVCDRNDNDPLYKTRPVLLAEVLSAGSLRHDPITKTNIYRTIESLQVHLILSQDAPLIELYKRAGNWQRQTFGLDDSFTVAGLECEQSVREVYIDVLDVMRCRGISKDDSFGLLLLRVGF